VTSVGDEKAILRPVAKRPLSEQVFDQLCQAILSGRLAPGSFLPGERTLCDSLKVNRNSLREGLKRLEQSRFISIRQGQPTRILDFSESAQLDVLSHLLVKEDGRLDLEVARSVVELRAAIAPDVVRLATQRHGAELGPALLPLLGEMRADSHDPIRAQELSAQFWRIVVRASENIAYVLVFNTVNEVNLRLKTLLTHLLSSHYQNVAGFKAMIEAIVSGKAEAARRAAERHVAGIAGALESRIHDVQADGATEWRPVK